MGRGASYTGRSMSGSTCGLYRSENAGMSSENYARIIMAENLRFLTPIQSTCASAHEMCIRDRAGTNRWAFYPCIGNGCVHFWGSKAHFIFVPSALRDGFVPVPGAIGKCGPLSVFQTGRGS